MAWRRISTVRRFIQPVSVLVTLGWPLLIWLGLHYQIMHWMLPAMIALLVLRLVTGRKSAPLARVTVHLVWLALLLAVASAVLKQHQLMLFYPVLVNAVLLLVFGGSLLRGTPIIERIARWRDPHLPPAAVRYTRRVTQVWCAFFIINGGIALFTCLSADMTLWAAWNGLFSYLCMGLLMAGEWLVRQWLIRRLKP